VWIAPARLSRAALLAACGLGLTHADVAFGQVPQPAFVPPPVPPTEAAGPGVQVAPPPDVVGPADPKSTPPAGQPGQPGSAAHDKADQEKPGQPRAKRVVFYHDPDEVIGPIEGLCLTVKSKIVQMQARPKYLDDYLRRLRYAVCPWCRPKVHYPVNPYGVYGYGQGYGGNAFIPAGYAAPAGHGHPGNGQAGFASPYGRAYDPLTGRMYAPGVMQPNIIEAPPGSYGMPGSMPGGVPYPPGSAAAAVPGDPGAMYQRGADGAIRLVSAEQLAPGATGAPAMAVNAAGQVVPTGSPLPGGQNGAASGIMQTQLIQEGQGNLFPPGPGALPPEVFNDPALAAGYPAGAGGYPMAGYPMGGPPMMGYPMAGQAMAGQPTVDRTVVNARINIPSMGGNSVVYPTNPYYFDPRDGRIYAAPGYGQPIAQPLAPNVEMIYNYSHGFPGSRLTPVSRMPNQPGQQP
jgi:hypothetical protein